MNVISICPQGLWERSPIPFANAVTVRCSTGRPPPNIPNTSTSSASLCRIRPHPNRLRHHRHGCLSGRHRPWPTPPRYQHASNLHSQTRTHSREMKLWRLTASVNLTTLAFFLRICLIICTFTSFGNDHLVLIVFFRPCFLFPSKKPPKRDLLLVPAAHIFRIISFSSP